MTKIELGIEKYEVIDKRIADGIKKQGMKLVGILDSDLLDI